MAATGMTRRQFVEAMVFQKIRGPIGGPREDAYALMAAVFAAGPRKNTSVRDFLHWLPDPDEDDDPDDDEPYDPETDED